MGGRGRARPQRSAQRRPQGHNCRRRRRRLPQAPPRPPAISSRRPSVHKWRHRRRPHGPQAARPQAMLSHSSAGSSGGAPLQHVVQHAARAVLEQEVQVGVCRGGWGGAVRCGLVRCGAVSNAWVGVGAARCQLGPPCHCTLHPIRHTLHRNTQPSSKTLPSPAAPPGPAQGGPLQGRKGAHPCAWWRTALAGYRCQPTKADLKQAKNTVLVRTRVDCCIQLGQVRVVHRPQDGLFCSHPPHLRWRAGERAAMGQGGPRVGGGRRSSGAGALQRGGRRLDCTRTKRTHGAQPASAPCCAPPSPSCPSISVQTGGGRCRRRCRRPAPRPPPTAAAQLGSPPPHPPHPGRPGGGSAPAGAPRPPAAGQAWERGRRCGWGVGGAPAAASSSCGSLCCRQASGATARSARAP